MSAPVAIANANADADDWRRRRQPLVSQSIGDDFDDGSDYNNNSLRRIIDTTNVPLPTTTTTTAPLPPPATPPASLLGSSPPLSFVGGNSLPDSSSLPLPSPPSSDAPASGIGISNTLPRRSFRRQNTSSSSWSASPSSISSSPSSRSRLAEASMNALRVAGKIVAAPITMVTNNGKHYSHTNYYHNSIENVTHNMNLVMPADGTILEKAVGAYSKLQKDVKITEGMKQVAEAERKEFDETMRMHYDPSIVNLYERIAGIIPATQPINFAEEVVRMRQLGYGAGKSDQDVLDSALRDLYSLHKAMRHRNKRFIDSMQDAVITAKISPETEKEKEHREKHNAMGKDEHKNVLVAVLERIHLEHARDMKQKLEVLRLEAEESIDADSASVSGRSVDLRSVKSSLEEITEEEIEEETEKLKEILMGLDPNDPKFKEFLEKLLKKLGVPPDVVAKIVYGTTNKQGLFNSIQNFEMHIVPPNMRFMITALQKATAHRIVKAKLAEVKIANDALAAVNNLLKDAGVKVNGAVTNLEDVLRISSADALQSSIDSKAILDALQQRANTALSVAKNGGFSNNAEVANAFMVSAVECIDYVTNATRPVSYAADLLSDMGHPDLARALRAGLDSNDPNLKARINDMMNKSNDPNARRLLNKVSVAITNQESARTLQNSTAQAPAPAPVANRSPNNNNLNR